MVNVTYHVTLADPAGAPVPHHRLRVKRIEAGSEVILLGPTPLNPDGSLEAIRVEVPHRNADPAGYFVVEVFGPADNALWPSDNYHTHLALPRKHGGAIDFVMPEIKTADLYAGATPPSAPAPAVPPLTVADLVAAGGDTAETADFASPILLDARRVGVRVTDTTGAPVEGYGAQLSIHGWHWWSRRQPLAHPGSGHEFLLRRTETVTWVHLYKTGVSTKLSSARVWLGPRDVAVVFVLPGA